MIKIINCLLKNYSNHNSKPDRLDPLYTTCYVLKKKTIKFKNKVIATYTISTLCK